ncbi:catabolite repression protein creC [Pluteus cervinus]|uniref:Catabolite repression protein creC n=1 Tax=Pluteus cervinus TaxID=181527 RepID=A0ACD3BGV6_9AGAR|nr:catabolite repression protein creC [Pluteus cervinus]
MENDSSFVAPEGVYTVTDELKPLLLQPTTGPSSSLTRVTPVLVRYPATKSNGPPGFAQLLGGAGNKESKKEKPVKDREDGASLSGSESQDEAEQSHSAGQENMQPTPGVPAEQHTLFAQSPPVGKKKQASRPKHGMRGTSSTFITRMQTMEGLTKYLQSKQGEVTYLFYNQGRSFLWVEAGSKAKEPLARITFSSAPTCHDVNLSTASPEHLDVIIGFSTGDLIWLDPISSRYSRLNKQGCISSSSCTAVRWVPSSSMLFLASHVDGTIIVYDNQREDGAFTPQQPTGSSLDPTGTTPSEDSSNKEWDPFDNIFVTMPPWHPVSSASNIGGAGRGEKEKAVKNPVSHWRLSKKSVVDFVFSPDVKYVAAISEDGCLRVIDALAEQLVDCYASYFGALTCVAWSPDGRFIITGGQDDLLTIFSPWEQRIIARCQGHSSFVAAIAFDDLRCDGRTYRFGSVGEDNKLILWDFSSGSLHRPKFQAYHQRISMSSTLSLAFRRDKSASYLPSFGMSGADTAPISRYHPALSRNEVAVVQPVLIKQLDSDIPSAVTFLPRCLLTSTKTGHIKLWVRPLPPRSKSKNVRPPLADIHDLSTS